MESRKAADRYSGLMMVLKRGKDAEAQKGYAQALQCYQAFLADGEAQHSKYAEQTRNMVERFFSSGLAGALMAEGDERCKESKLAAARECYAKAKAAGANTEVKLKELTNIGRRLFEEGCKCFQEGMPGQARNNFIEALSCFEADSADYKRITTWIRANNFNID